MLNKDCILIYERYKLLSEIREKRYKVIFGSSKTGLTKDIYVPAKDKKEALDLAKIKIEDDYSEFHYDHIHPIIEKPWPKDNEYLHHAIEDADGYDAT